MSELASESMTSGERASESTTPGEPASEPTGGLVVVTGAAGALGVAVLAEFRARGAEVVAMDLASERLTELGRRDGVHGVAADLTDVAAVRAAWAEVDAIGAPAAMVCVAGGFAGGGLDEIDPAALDGQYRLNVATALWCCQAAAERMRAAGGGAIVAVGSRVAVTGTGPIAYTLAKTAVVRMTEVLAEELRPSRIRVNAVLPSVLDTPANRSWMSAAAIERAVPTAAVAKVIAFLCGPDAWPISGAAIPVYGDA